ncbi:MAG: (2Fe-2S)-binding protein [Anaerolineaceae bacterium]
MKRIIEGSPLIPKIERGKKIQVIVDDKRIEAFEGETVAAALLTVGITTFRHSQKNKEPRGLYCGMGICYECLVTINGVHAQRACITTIEDGMRIETCKELKL